MKRELPVQSRRWMRFLLAGMLCFMGWGIIFLPPGWAQEKEIKVLTREEALRIALEKNKDIQKAQEYRNSVMGRYVEERSAALPQLQLSGGYARDRDDATKEVFRGLFPAEKETWAAEVGVSQVLYAFGRVGAAIRAAKIGLATAEDQLKIFQQAAWRDVSSAFDDVLLAKEIYALAVQNYDQKVRIQDETRRKHAAGVATDYDVLAADVAVENARPEVIRRENQIRVSREKLRFLLGLEGEEVDAKGTFEETLTPYPPYEKGVDTAWQSRPDLSDLQKRIGIAVELVKIYDAGDKPRVDLKGSYGYRDINYFDVSRGDGQVWSAGVFLTFPFFDGMRSRGKTAQAKSDLSSLKIDEAKLKDSIALQVRDALNACREAEEIVKALSGTVRQAEKLLSMAERGYEYGVKTKLEVDDAQLSVIQAKGNLARARRDSSVARVTLDWVLGTAGEKTNK
ncbi:MAG: efflux pump, family, outer membrane protein [Deltaproteobacteria bacterium]|nr:efflux pump, family, outer membrane protein [Deltaproteobacteria bacterium]